MTCYSHSRISTFEQCRYKYKLQYIDRVKVDVPTTVEAFMGKRVHETLEKLYSDLKFCKENSLPDLLKFLQEEWKKNWHDNVVIVRKGMTPENYLLMAIKFVSDYYETYEPFTEKVIAIEKKISIDLGEGYKLIGYIDRLDFGDDYEIHDYKTNGNLTAQEYLDKDRQLALYALAIKNEFPDAKDVKLVWHFLAFNKEMYSSRTDQELEDLKKSVIDLIKEIESCKKFEPKESALCNWCDYKEICPRFKHSYSSGEFKSNNQLTLDTIDENNPYLKDDGSRLVDEYVKLNERKKKTVDLIDQELEKIDSEGDAIEFAKKEFKKLNWENSFDDDPNIPQDAQKKYLIEVEKQFVEKIVSRWVWR